MVKTIHDDPSTAAQHKSLFFIDVFTIPMVGLKNRISNCPRGDALGLKYGMLNLYLRLSICIVHIQKYMMTWIKFKA